MDDYIKREDAIKICKMPNYNIHDILFALKTIPGKMIPAADVRENVHAHWIVDDGHYKCSNCKTSWYMDLSDDKFCSNCGADMREGGSK